VGRVIDSLLNRKPATLVAGHLLELAAYFLSDSIAF
jgi:hypothetical protein